MFDVKQKVENYMSVVLTHDCNKSCPFCIDDYRNSGEYISMEYVDKAIKVALDNNISDILLIGGEPTLHPKVVEIAEKFSECSFKTIMTTNYTKPEVIKQLDGIVDCFNISFYNQANLPKQSDFSSDITLHALIHKHQLNTVEKIDAFIEQYKDCGHIKFSTLFPGTAWAKNNQIGEFLDNIDCEWVVLFNELLGQVYKDSIIKRYDRIINNKAKQSIKFHVDGTYSFSWDRQTP